MALKGKNIEEKIWFFFTSKGISAHGAAGLMGNLYAESALNPQNLQNSYEKSLGYTDETYTSAVDSGEYNNFVNDSAGYGLAQWTYYTRKAALLNYAKNVGASVGDLETQLGFLYKELSSNYSGLLSALRTATSVRAASDAVLTIYERPADMSEHTKTQRANYGQIYFDKYENAQLNPQPAGKYTAAGTEPVMPMQSKEAIATLKYKTGEVLYFSGIVHYENANASSGPACKPGTVRITTTYADGKHPYHVIGQAGGGSTAYGWVDADKLSPITEIKIGDFVHFKGGPHYLNSNAVADSGRPKAGMATVTMIAKGTKHPYHVVHKDEQSTVYGWVDANLVEKA